MAAENSLRRNQNHIGDACKSACLEFLWSFGWLVGTFGRSPLTLENGKTKQFYSEK